MYVTQLGCVQLLNFYDYHTQNLMMLITKHSFKEQPCCTFWFLAKKMMADECSPSAIQMQGNRQYRLLKEQEWEEYQNMAEEANIREEKEAKSKEAQVNRLISSIQANIPVLISVLFPRLYRLMWGNPDSTIKEIFARGMQNPDNHWFWNRESWDLNSGIQAKRSGIPLTTVPRTKNPECVNFCTFHSLGFFNY